MVTREKKVLIYPNEYWEGLGEEVVGGKGDLSRDFKGRCGLEPVCAPKFVRG